MSTSGSDGPVVRVVGEGHAEVAADGFADAEHLVEKELHRVWSVGGIQILGVSRPPGPARIVDHYAVSYRLKAEFEAEPGQSAADAGEAFRKARSLLSGTRYGQTEWRLADPARIA